MRVAYVMSPGKGDTDLILFEAAEKLITAGYSPTGIVQVNTDRFDGRKCDMDVRVLRGGPSIRISQNLGVGAKGCRLDPDALESAVAMVADRLEGADCLIINKFGKHEAEGRGFRHVIADAVATGIPVIVGLNPLNQEEFLKFCGETVDRIEPDTAAVMRWAQQEIDALKVQV